MSDELSDADYAEMLANRAKLHEARTGPRGAEVEEALRDFAQFPPQSGDIK